MRHAGLLLAPALLVAAGGASATAPPAPATATTTTTSTTTTSAPPSPSPPTAVTGPASGVSLTTATLSGNVDPNGTATSWAFEYGTTAGYGSRTPSHDAGAGSTSTAVTSALSGLAPGTTYHYRLVATSAAGTTEGRDDTFTTTASRPTAVTGAPTGTSATGSTVHGSVDPNGLATVWYVRYGTSTAYGASTATESAGSGLAPVAVSTMLVGLRPGTTYHVQLGARNAVGTSYGADLAFATPGAPAVTTGGATSLGPDGADLHGTVDPNGLATSWYVRYGTTARYGVTSRASGVGSGTAPVRVSVSIGGLAPDTTYHYDVVASSSAGTAYGADATFTTIGAPRATTGAASDVGPFSARLSGVVEPSGAAAAWHFEYGTTSSATVSTEPQRTAGTASSLAVSAVVTGLAPGATYRFRLVATGPGGTSYGIDGEFSTPGPTLRAGPRSASAIVTYGRAVELAGGVPSGRAGETVRLFGVASTGGSFVGLATVRTGDGGSWTYRAVPRDATVYEAVWDGATSARVVVRVRPAVFLRGARGGRFVARVVEHARLAGRLLRLQRLVGRQWRVAAAARLDARGLAVLRPRLPAGESRVRALLTGFQAGPGYLTGTSAVHLVRRR